MTGTNTPKPHAEGVKKADTPRQNMLELFDDVAEEKVFNFLHNEAVILRELRDNPNKICMEIREEMRRKLIESPDGYENFTEEDIFNTSKISDKTVREKLEILLVDVKSGQEKLQTKVRAMFAPETFADTPDGNDNRRRLDEWIPKQNSKDIEKYLKSPGLLRRKLGRECFGDDRISTFVSRDTFVGLEDLGIRVNDLSDSEKDAVKAIFGGAINSERQHIQTYLKIIDRSPKDNATKIRLKKNLIRTAFPTVSPKFLVDNNIITEAVGKERVRIGLQGILGADYFTTGTDSERLEKQRYLDHVYIKSEHIELPIDEYLDNDAFVESVFAKGKIGETEFTKKLEDILTDMRSEITLAEFDLDGMHIDPDVQGNWHASVVSNIASLKDEKNQKVKNAEKFDKGSYIRIIQNRNGKEKYSYIKILDTDVEFSMYVDGMRDKNGLPIKHRGIRFEDWTGDGDSDAMVTPGNERGGLEQPYAKLWTLLKDPNTKSEILTEDEIHERRKIDYAGEDRIYTAPSEGDTYNSIGALTDVLGWTPTKGDVYTTQDMVGGADFFLEIVDIIDTDANKKITVSDGKETHTVSFQDFYNKLARGLKLKETGKYQSENDISGLIQNIDGFKDIQIKNGILVQVVKGEDGKDVDIPVHHFMNDDGEGMYISEISNGGVSAGFGQVKVGKDGKDWSEIKGKTNLKAFSGNKMNLSIVGMLNMLRENDYKPYINPKDQPRTDDHEEHMPHTHGSLWGKIMNGTSVSDMMKAFDLYKHAWEHKLEKNSKFQSAKFADKYLRGLMPEGFSYQLRSEAYSAQNEAMEGILKMLENDMSGKEARLYIRKKILLNDDAKFEEVLAGLLYISKKAGQLYPEELSDLKNSNIWFHKLAVTQGYTTKDSRAWLRAKCIQSSDKGAEDINAITEIDLIERQLKFYEGKGHRIPPNIAPKFPGAIREGEDDSKKKGETEVNQRSNIKQMNKYALSKAYVGEWYKVLGTVDRLHSKNGSPTELNAMPFLMVYSNAPEYMGSNYRKALHSEGTGSRASHAFKFGNEMHLVNTYRDVVQMAAEEVSRRKGGDTTILKELQDIEAKRKEVGNHNHDDEPDEFQKKWITSIYNFWMTHGKELQPILQMSDPFIMAKAKQGDAKAKKYQTRYNALSGMQNGQVDKIYENANVHEGNMSRDHTPFHFTNLANALFNDVYTQDGHLKHGDTTYAKIFKPGILGAFYDLKKMKAGDLPPDIDLREAQYDQFREYYAAIMYYIRQKANPPEKLIGGKKDQYSFQPQQYIMDLRNIGFNITREDFPVSSTLTVGGVGQEQDGQYTETYLNANEERRCRAMFDEFMRTTSSAMDSIRRGVHSAFDYDGHGG